jgi:DNA polymerase V
LPVTEIAGIAGRRQARLAPYGVKSCLDLARMDRRLVRAVLTVTGEKLHRELNGEPVDPIRPQRLPHQTISRGGSIGRATADPMVVRAWLVRNLERLIEELEYHRVRPGRVGLWLVYRQGPVGTGAVSLEVCSDRFDLLLEAFTECFEQAWRAGELVTGMHLVAMQLHGEGPVQRGLFEPPPGRAEALARLKRSVNTRVRRFALRSGATLYSAPRSLRRLGQRLRHLRHPRQGVLLAERRPGPPSRRALPASRGCSRPLSRCAATSWPGRGL